jgi:hypothetical protein
VSKKKYILNPTTSTKKLTNHVTNVPFTDFRKRTIGYIPKESLEGPPCAPNGKESPRGGGRVTLRRLLAVLLLAACCLLLAACCLLLLPAQCRLPTHLSSLHSLATTVLYHDTYMGIPSAAAIEIGALRCIATLSTMKMPPKRPSSASAAAAAATTPRHSHVSSSATVCASNCPSSLWRFAMLISYDRWWPDECSAGVFPAERRGSAPFA